jgi:hypothetical protein
MGAGEYVSVSSQRDTEGADLRLEERELSDDAEGELRELADIYERRGVPFKLARRLPLRVRCRPVARLHSASIPSLGWCTRRCRAKPPRASPEGMNGARQTGIQAA